MDTPLLPEQFAPLRGQRFVVCADDAHGAPLLSAELIEVQSLPQPAFNGRPPFSLLFCGPQTPVLPQSIYRLALQDGPAAELSCSATDAPEGAPPRLPPIDIFLVPVAADAAGVRYQAIFS